MQARANMHHAKGDGPGAVGRGAMGAQPAAPGRAARAAMSTVIRIVWSEAGGAMAERERRRRPAQLVRSTVCCSPLPAGVMFLVVGPERRHHRDGRLGFERLRRTWGWSTKAWVAVPEHAAAARGEHARDRGRPAGVSGSSSPSFRALNVVFTGVLALALTVVKPLPVVAGRRNGLMVNLRARDLHRQDVRVLSGRWWIFGASSS